MSLDNLNLRAKSLAPLVMMCLTALALVAFGASRLSEASKTASHMVEERDVGALKLSMAGRAIVYVPYSVFGAILFDDDSAAGQATKHDFETTAQKGLTLLKAAAELLPDRAADIAKLEVRLQALYEQAKAPFEEGYAQPGIDHGTSLKPSELAASAHATKLAGALDADARALVEDLNATRNSVLAENAKAAQQLKSDSRTDVVTLGAIGVVSALLAGAFAMWMTTAKIVRPLNRLGEQMRALADGDLSVEIDGRERRDEIGAMAKAVEVFKTNALARQRAEAQAEASRAQVEAEKAAAAGIRAQAAEAQDAAMTALREGLRRLAQGHLTVRLDQGFAGEYAQVRDDFNEAVDKLKSAVAAVVQSTDAIRSSSQEISSASDDLSQRTEQQAASLEETAAALEEITTTVKASAANAQHAAEVVASADSDAKNGAVVVRQAVEAMDAIAQSSHQIGQIIGAVDEIAFQTNLLALNAGVEAARAGDSGRGFAVVASEVRALAQRSAEAAKEIKALVSASGAQVSAGVKLVADTGKALEAIISQVSQINSAVAGIASSAQQQATGLQQINAAISQMDQSTQQNATMVEESTAATRALTHETGELQRLVGQFSVGDGGEARLRRDLKSVAPHAFAKPAPAPARAKGGLREVAKSAGGDWAEF